jgi:hypothetical protein
VTIKCLSEGISDTALYILDKNFRFVKGTISTFASGKTLTFELNNPERGPFSEAYSLIPCDFPAFPITSNSTMEFSLIKDLTGGLKIQKKISQVVRTNDNNFNVLCVLDGAFLFRQIWDKRFPIPISGENVNMRYELVAEGDFSSNVE